MTYDEPSITARLRFDFNAKAPKPPNAPSTSRLRYIVYSKTTSLDEFRPIHPVPKFARPDLNNDMTVGLVLVHEDDISAEHRVHAVIDTATFISVLALAQQRMDSLSRPPLERDTANTFALDRGLRRTGR